MTKHALRAFSNCLRMENPNVKVVSIEPVLYRTEMTNLEQIRRTRDRYFEQTPAEIKEVYDQKVFHRMDKFLTMIDNVSRTNLDEVIDALANGVCLHEPKLFYRCCGYFDIFALFGLSSMPEVIQDFVQSKILFNKYTMQLAEFVARRRQTKAE